MDRTIEVALSNWLKVSFSSTFLDTEPPWMRGDDALFAQARRKSNNATMLALQQTIAAAE